MSESLQFVWKVNGVRVPATSVVLASADGTYGIRREDTGEVIVPASTTADPQPMTLDEDNVYRYSLPDGLDGVELSWVARVVYNDVVYHFEQQTYEPAEPVESNIGLPVFEHVAILMDRSRADLRVAAIEGLTTRHGVMVSDRGRLYATLDQQGVSYRVRLYADTYRTRLVMQGQTSTLGEQFRLDAANASGMNGFAVLASYFQPAKATLIPTFAVDSDVAIQPEAAANLPGYDPTYGLAFVHAQQHRALLLNELPAAVPHLYAEGAMAGYLATNDGTPALPPIDKIANVDALRVAQAMLVKAAAAEQDEHVEEWEAIATAARKRFDSTMAKFKAANPTAAEREAEDAGDTYTVATFFRS